LAGQEQNGFTSQRTKKPFPFHFFVGLRDESEATRSASGSIYSDLKSQILSNFCSDSDQLFIGSGRNIRWELSSNPKQNAAQSPCSLAVPQTSPGR
jgi:hypothetical protein